MGQLLLDFFIFFARHMVLAFLAFLGLWVLLDFKGGLRSALDRLSPGFGRRLTIVISLVVLAGFLGIGVWYLTLDGFAGEVEPVVASLSWLVQNGQPLYHDLESAELYSVLYGPSVFLTNGLFLKVLGPSLFSAKLASFLSILGCLLFLYAALARSTRDWVALLVTSLAALYFWSQGFAAYLVRPDALLLFSVGLALYTAVKAGRLTAVLTVAVMLGFAVNLKVHAVIYFLPILVLLFQRFGLWQTLWAVSGSAVIIIAPFVLHPQVSAPNYVDWVLNAVEHGLVTDTLAACLQFTGYLLLPLAALVFVSPMRSLLLKRHALYLASLLGALGITLVLSAKPGAGLVHLLPLVPTTLYLVGLMLHEVFEMAPGTPEWRPSLSRVGILAAVLMTAMLSGSVNAYRAVRLVEWQVAEAPGLVADVQGVMERYPDITIGMACGGEDDSFRHTWLRPLLVFANHPLLVEPIAVMECQLTGKEIPQKTFRALEDGVVAMWLVPRDQRPFDKLNWYAPHDPVFSDKFMEHFESLHSKLDHSRYFDLWFWNGGLQSLNGFSGFPAEESVSQDPASP